MHLQSTKILILLGLIVIGCTTKPPLEVYTETIVDLSYDDLKQQYHACNGKGVMTAQGSMPWKMNFSFTTQNDSSYILFKDIIGRRALFVQALPTETLLWDMLKNQCYTAESAGSIPVFNILESEDIAQILWGEQPDIDNNNDSESSFEMDSNSVNFEMSSTQNGMITDKVIFQLDSPETTVEFKISKRKYGASNPELLLGIPKNIPIN